MRVIVLAAGQALQVDGINKCLIKDPQSGETILDKLINIFSDYKITVVLGYQAIKVMQEYPQLDFVYNRLWATSNNSFSLSLALDSEPCFVLSSDLFFEEALIDYFNKSGDNILLTGVYENKYENSLNCELLENKIINIYSGPTRNINHPQSLGIFKISDKMILNIWKKNCLKNPNLFAAENLPLDIENKSIESVSKKDFLFHEINTPEDYIQFINLSKERLK